MSETATQRSRPRAGGVWSLDAYSAGPNFAVRNIFFREGDLSMTTALPHPLPPLAKDFFQRVAKMYEASDDLPTEIADFWHSAHGEGPEDWSTEDLRGFDLRTLREIPKHLGRLSALAEKYGDLQAVEWIEGMGYRVEEWLMSTFPEYLAEADFRRKQDEADDDDTDADPGWH